MIFEPFEISKPARFNARTSLAPSSAGDLALNRWPLGSRNRNDDAFYACRAGIARRDAFAVVATRQNAKLDHFARVCKGLFDRVTLSTYRFRGFAVYRWRAPQALITTWP